MARDFLHEVIVIALEKDDWTITHDPYQVPVGRRRAYIDIGAERVIAATKEDEKIAVEIKSFIGISELSEFEKALGQFNIYFVALKDKEPDRVLYLAVSEDFYNDFLDEPFMQKIISFYNLKIIVVRVITKTIVKWIK